MKGNTSEDIKKVDEFNDFMIMKGLFLKTEDGQIVINPNPVMIGSNEHKFEYTMSQAIQDFKSLNK